MTAPLVNPSNLELVRYEAAIHALAECKAVDEVKAWADRAAAIQAYGRMAKDKTLEVDAAEIRIRAERRLGEMILEQKKTVGLNQGARLQGKDEAGTSVVVTDDRREHPTLADAGISKDMSSRSQKLAAVPAEEFEEEVGAWRERVQEEGRRVTARLEQAGERELKKRPGVAPSRTRPEQPGELEGLRRLVNEREAQLEEIRAELQETLKLLHDTEEENKSFGRVIEADDQVAAAMAEAKRFRELARVTQERNNGLMGQNHALAKDAKRWMNKFLRLERLTKGELAASDPEPNDEDLGDLFPDLDPTA